VVQNATQHPPAIIRENPCSSVAKKTSVALHLPSRLRVRKTAGKVRQMHSRNSTDLGLESPSSINSCPFVSIRGLKTNPNISPAFIRGTAPADSRPRLAQPNTKHQTPNNEPVRFPSRLRGFA
jgi:hypothetical protein